MKKGFDNDKYLQMQSEHIRERIAQFDNKLYLEFGGKLFDDYHASRVLPGFQPDSKLQMLLQLKDQAEVVIVINAEDIVSSKVRGDYGITYDLDVLRLIDAFQERGLFVGSVCVTMYTAAPEVEAFEKRLNSLGIRTFRHYKIPGYPNDVARIVSDEGYGRNEYIETQRPLVVITAPGPGSGKMATCLSQLYHEYKRGVKAGYAKFETFPIWNIPLKHPVNLAYEAATADLNDVNMIDPFHLEAYGKTAVNYNRDIEIFPVVNAMFELIAGKSPYHSPTDMGVNMAGNCIVDDAACCEASRNEIVRRYFKALCDLKNGAQIQSEVYKLELLMNQAGLTQGSRPVEQAAHAVSEKTGGAPAAAIELPDGTVVTPAGCRLLRPAQRAEKAGRHRPGARPRFCRRHRAHPDPQDQLSGQQEPPPAHRRDPDCPVQLGRAESHCCSRPQAALPPEGLRYALHCHPVQRGYGYREEAGHVSDLRTHL